MRSFHVWMEVLAPTIRRRCPSFFWLPPPYSSCVGSLLRAALSAYFLAKFRFDTAENEPAKNLQNDQTLTKTSLRYGAAYEEEEAEEEYEEEEAEEEEEGEELEAVEVNAAPAAPSGPWSPDGGSSSLRRCILFEILSILWN